VPARALLEGGLGEVLVTVAIDLGVGDGLGEGSGLGSGSDSGVASGVGDGSGDGDGSGGGSELADPLVALDKIEKLPEPFGLLPKVIPSPGLDVY